MPGPQRVPRLLPRRGRNRSRRETAQNLKIKPSPRPSGSADGETERGEERREGRRVEAGGDARGLQQKGEGAQSRERAELPPPPHRSARGQGAESRPHCSRFPVFILRVFVPRSMSSRCEKQRKAAWKGKIGGGVFFFLFPLHAGGRRHESGERSAAPSIARCRGQRNERRQEKEFVRLEGGPAAGGGEGTQPRPVEKREL